MAPTSSGPSVKGNPVAPQKDRRGDLFCLVLLGILTAAYFWRCLFTSAVLLPTDIVLRLQPWRSYSPQLFPEFQRIYNPLLDIVLLFYPWRVFAARAMAGGQIPLWNPDSFCGQPFLANISSAVLYPPNLLFYLMEPARAYGYVTALHTFLAGAFVFLYLRLLGLRRPAALLGGITFMFCGFLTVWAEYQTPVAATIWLPLALYYWERYARGHGRRFAIYTALPLGLSLLGGHLQYATYVLLAFGVYAAWRSGRNGRRWLLAAGVGMLALALAAHQLLPALELGKYNHRADGQPLAGVLGSALPLKHLITFLAPSFFGHPVDYNYWSSLNYVEYCGYLGVLPLLLLIPALWLRRDRYAVFFTLLALVTLLMILGAPLYAVLYYLMPGFKQLNNPARMLGIFSFAIACLGAFGADALASLPAARRRTLLLLCTGFLLAACAALSALYTRNLTEIVSYGQQASVATAVAVFLAIALASLALVALSAGRQRALWLLPSLVAVDLFLFGMRFNPAGDPRMLFFPTASLDYLRQQPGQFRVLALAAPGSDFMNAMIPNCNLPVGLAEIQGGDALYPRRYRQFAEFVESRKQGHPVHLGNGLSFSSPDTPCLDFLNDRYVLSPTPLRSPRLELVSNPDIYLYRNRAARPRAFLVHRAVVAQPSQVLERMAAEKFALDQVAVLEQQPALTPVPPAGEEEATITSAQACRVDVSVRAASNSLLVLADQNFPGWQAQVDGRPAPLYAADYILRATPVPPGEHTVTFLYRPCTFLLGLYLSLCALSVLVAVATYSRFRRA